MGPVDVTVDLRFLPDLDDLSCHQDIRLPSVAHNRPPAAARAHAAPEGTTDAGATERPVMSGHDRTQPRSKAVYRQAAWSRYSRRGTMTQPDAELPHLGNRIADLVRLILVRPALRPTREMASSARMTVSEPTSRVRRNAHRIVDADQFGGRNRREYAAGGRLRQHAGSGHIGRRLYERVSVSGPPPQRSGWPGRCRWPARLVRARG